MSSCYGTVPAKGFGLDWNAPFTFDERTIFILLGCSTNSSSIHSSKFLCDQGTTICSLLNSCRPISTINVDLPSSCLACERSHGACGYTRYLNSFICSCPSGTNTTTDCFFAPYYDGGFRNGVAWLLVLTGWSLVGFFL
ncbi:uncharacterized protein LOC129310489 [Prosopis cineraria]|uniref:uncharacterized protein LOC129310489 n=1 Tax=Prosopis cineraria TaxID=364024 RepID=UPI00240F0E82|nr:uncharacterized protein LOC129310489 [Prosopis cineraria]